VAQTSATATTSTLADLLRQSETGRVTTAFVQDSWRPLSHLVVAPGVRVVRYDVTGETYFEPRVSATYQIRPDVRLTGGWSIDHQIVNRIVREDRVHGDGGFWALADGNAIPVAKAQQAVAGLNVSRNGVTFDLSGFYKRFDHLTLFAPRLYTGMAPEPGADLFYEGTGTAAGIEAILQHRVARNALSFGYTLSRVDNTYPALEDETFPASIDQLNELKMTEAFQITAGWWVSGAFVVGSGRPYTAASGIETVWFPTGAVLSQIKFGDKNALRLPPYHRLDLSTARDFPVGRIVLSLGGTIFNVYDQKSAIAVDYDSIAGTLAAHDVTQMGRAFNAFLRVRF
jgi:outer membrane receptor protein involved in Fe transport